MFSALTTTELLAAFIGLYFVAAGVGLILDRDSYAKMVTALVDQPVWGYFGGLFAFIIGSAIIAVHNDWTSVLSGFVSAIGWIALIEGVLILAARKWFLTFFASLSFSGSVVSGFGLTTGFIGVVLILSALA